MSNYRLMFYNPHRRRHIISYGIVAYAKDTERYLVVRRRFSPHYLIFLSGSYRISNMPLLLLGMTQEELRLIRRMLYNNIEYQDVVKLVLPLVDMKYAVCRWTRHQDEICRLLNHIQHTTDSPAEPEWLFPKGRSEWNEAPLTAALREFREETGVEVNDTDLVILNEHPITITHMADNDFIYETQYFVACVSSELVLPATFTNFEIAFRRWHTRQELATLLGPQQLTVVNEAHRFVLRNGESSLS